MFQRVLFSEISEGFRGSELLEDDTRCSGPGSGVERRMRAGLVWLESDVGISQIHLGAGRLRSVEKRHVLPPSPP